MTELEEYQLEEMAMNIVRNCYVPDNPSSDDVREVVEEAAFDMANRILSKVQVVNIQRKVHILKE